MQILQGLNATPWGLRKGNIEIAIGEQKNIGNEKMWLGFLAQSWGDIQEKNYRDMQEDKKLTGTRWERLMFKEFLLF